MNAMRVLFSSRNGSPAPTSELNGSHLGWRTPALYLFVGVVGMLALIGFASVLLVCTWCRLAAGSRRGTTQSTPELEFMESGPMKVEIVRPNDEQEPCDKVLVIMPGDQGPTFFAKQSASVAVGAEDRG